MTARPSNGRVHGHSAFGNAISVGVLIASIALVVFVVCGGLK